MGNVLDDYTPSSAEVTLDRDRLCSDIANTATVAALISGFSLGTVIGSTTIEQSFLPLAIYSAHVFAVHLCTCACLMSAMMYVYANGLTDADAIEWVQHNEWLLPIPLMKFGAGTVSYLVAVSPPAKPATRQAVNPHQTVVPQCIPCQVILKSWQDLKDGNAFVFYLCTIIGVTPTLTLTLVHIQWGL